MMMLALDDVHARRGDTQILHGVSLRVAPGEMVALVGRNGMGKTTLLRSVIGLADVTAGHVFVKGHDLTRAPTHSVVRQGIGVVPEGRGIFPALKVSENLRMGLHSSRGHDTALRIIYERFPLLAQRANEHAANLSGGQQQILAIARALISKPQLLLIDEFSEGIQPTMVRDIGNMLQDLNRQGTAVLLVEQNARLALGISQRCYILEKGRIAAEGPSAQFLQDESTLAKHLVL